MGITGLQKYLKEACRDANLKEFKGQTVGVDALCLLHKGGFACATDLATGQDTNVYVNYIVKFVKMMLDKQIHRIILVFDGQSLPAKQLTNARRKERREDMKKLGNSLLLEGKDAEAHDKFRQSVEITKEMIAKVIQSFRSHPCVDCIVAPYEADAQLTYLSTHKFIDLIITEDSDLIPFGSEKIFFKMDLAGNGRLYEKAKLPAAYKSDQHKLRRVCILSGCDYLDSLPGVALMTAAKFFDKIQQTEPIDKALRQMPKVLKKPSLEIPETYLVKFVEAENTFLHQIVFDPKLRKRVPLTPYPRDACSLDYPYCGKEIDDLIAYQVSLGNYNPNTLKPFKDSVFDPDVIDPRTKKITCGVISIWNPDHQPGSNKPEMVTNQLKITSSFESVKIKVNTAVISKAKSGTCQSSGIMRGSVEDEILKMYKIDLRQSTNLMENIPSHHIQGSSRYFSSSQSSSASSTDSSSSDDKIPSKSFLDTMDSSESSGSLGANNNSQCFSTASDESAKLRKRDLFGSPLIADYPVQFVHTPSAMSPYVPVTPMRTKSFNAAMKNEDFDLSRFQFAKRSKIDLEEDKAELDVLPQESPINSQVVFTSSAPIASVCVDLTLEEEQTEPLVPLPRISPRKAANSAQSKHLGRCSTVGLRKNANFKPPLLNKNSCQTDMKDFFKKFEYKKLKSPKILQS